MPIHLHPISRRSFLKRTALCLAALGSGSGAWAKSSRTDPNHWALLADTHIAADPERIAHKTNMAANLARVAQELIEMKTRVAGAIINGDCALTRGERGDYETLVKLLDPLGAARLPAHLTLGNHDDRQNFRDAFTVATSYEKVEFDKLVGVLKSPHANWFLLDSLDKVNATPGLLGDAQRQWLAGMLDANRQKPALIVAHHNLADTTAALQDTAQLLEILRPRKQVKAYIFGHTHRWNIVQDPSGIHLINLPPVAYVFHDGDPNGWVHAALERRGMRLQLNCLDKSHPNHGAEINLKWRAG